MVIGCQGYVILPELRYNINQGVLYILTRSDENEKRSLQLKLGLEKILPCPSLLQIISVQLLSIPVSIIMLIKIAEKMSVIISEVCTV